MAVTLDRAGGRQHERLAEIAVVELARALRPGPDPLAFRPRCHVIIDNMGVAEKIEREVTGPRPPDLHFAMTGEMFEFMTSARTGDGVFRFRWTLAGKKKGPPPHVHDDERETFAVVSGTLRIWLDGTPRDIRAGEHVTVERGVEHRFLNPASEPVVVDVSLDGPRQEDALVPLAYRMAGSKKMRLSDVFVMLVHVGEVKASRPKGKVAQKILSGLGRFIRLFGVKPLARVEHWH